MPMQASKVQNWRTDDVRTSADSLYKIVSSSRIDWCQPKSLVSLIWTRFSIFQGTEFPVQLKESKASPSHSTLLDTVTCHMPTVTPA